MADELKAISLSDLRQALRTVRAMRENFHSLSEDWGSVVEAERLILAEIMAQHGEAAWMVTWEELDADA